MDTHIETGSMPIALPTPETMTDAELVSLWMFEADLEAGFYDCDC